MSRFLFALFIILALASFANTATGQTIPPPFSCAAVTEIPQSECQALVALYNSTNGPGWGYGCRTATCQNGRDDWLTNNTPCTWYGVSCEDGHVSILYLAQNHLSGPLPPELGNLIKLRSLNLELNQLSGPLPPELGNLANLGNIFLGGNYLSGPLPPELGNLANLQELHLWGNALNGPIPPELGNLTNLQDLLLDRNQLRGAIPAELLQLANLLTLDLDYNALAATDPALLHFLAQKQHRWATTQTVVPTSVQASTLRADRIVVSWTPILYTGDGGYYEISYATNPTGPFTVHGVTPNKFSRQYTLTGLTLSPTYYVRVRTYTPTHVYNRNAIWSDYSSAIFVTTNDVYLPLISQ